MTPVTSTIPDDEVLAATRRWLERAVIGLNLCPFAKSVYVKNQVRLKVSHARHIDGFLEDLDHELELLKTASAELIDTTLLIHPTLFPDFILFNDFLDIVDQVLEEHQLEGFIQIASFHPNFAFDEEAENDMSHYTNRSPFPMLHLLREESLERAIENYGNTNQIYERNIAELRRFNPLSWNLFLDSDKQIN